MIHVTRRGTEVSAAPEDIARLRDEFEARHCVLLPSFLQGDLLRQLVEAVDRGPFTSFVHEGIGEEVCLDDPATLGLLTLVTNERRLFQAMEDLTGCGRIGCFEGRVYRMDPARGHYDSWHDDVTDTRLLALSVNLTPAPYEGGVLTVREKTSGHVTHAVANTGLGDAILFRVTPDLEHEVGAVTGTVPKTAYAGWFKAEPDFEDGLRAYRARR